MLQRVRAERRSVASHRVQGALLPVPAVAQRSLWEPVGGAVMLFTVSGGVDSSRVSPVGLPSFFFPLHYKCSVFSSKVYGARRGMGNGGSSCHKLTLQKKLTSPSDGPELVTVP